jgi:hypothetical protein
MYITEPGFYLVMAHSEFDSTNLFDRSKTKGHWCYDKDFRERMNEANPNEVGVVRKILDEMIARVQDHPDESHVVVTNNPLAILELNDADKTYVVSPEGNFKRMSDHPEWEASKGVLSPAEFWFDRFYSNPNGIDWINS